MSALASSFCALYPDCVFDSDYETYPETPWIALALCGVWSTLTYDSPNQQIVLMGPFCRTLRRWPATDTFEIEVLADVLNLAATLTG